MQLRILIAASWYRSAKAPVRGSFIREQALALAERGHEVHVVSFDRDALRLPLRIATRGDGPLHEHSIALPWPLHRLVGFYSPGMAARCFRSILDEVRPDVVHAHAARPGGVIAALAIADGDTPLVLTEHKSDLRTFWRSRHGWRQMQMAYARCARLYAVSNGLRNVIEQWFPATQGKWSVNYNGVDTSLFRIEHSRRPVGRGPELKILFLGGLAQRKGVRTLLEALLRLPKNFVLTIAGPQASPQRVRQLAAQYGVADRVAAVGLVDRPRVVSLLNEHDVLAAPSTNETFGLVCAESLACGVPVVATRCGGPEEIVVEPFGAIVEPNDNAALASALLRVLGGAAEWDGQKAREYVCEQFSMDSLVRRLEQDYAALTRSRDGTSRGALEGTTQPSGRGSSERIVTRNHPEGHSEGSFRGIVRIDPRTISSIISSIIPGPSRGWSTGASREAARVR
ncbi:MAG: glycosyltransferase [Steroidobacteraceae bacterium]|jgi:glycosyltransferase involved in cell wall biosynthesis|nr:glycosyltransferase [Steroidobacteraceae bacterium]